MRIEIDQSGKIEQTGTDTILAYSNGKQFAILIPSIVKREIVWKYRQQRKVNKIFFLKLFSTCIFLLIKDIINKLEEIVIDVEYEGNEGTIKNVLLNHIRKTKPNFDKNIILFRRVGKASNAHKVAIGVFKNERREDKIIRENEIEELL